MMSLLCDYCGQPIANSTGEMLPHIMVLNHPSGTNERIDVHPDCLDDYMKELKKIKKPK